LFQPMSFRGQSAIEGENASAGFTFIEALVALAVAAICLASIGSLVVGNMRGSRRIEQHIALIETLRAVETGLPDRVSLVSGTLEGDMHGRAWSVDVSPFASDYVNPRIANLWTPQTIVVTARSPSGGELQVETIRLAKSTGGQ